MLRPWGADLVPEGAPVTLPPRIVEPMSDDATSTTSGSCPHCGTAMESATIDFDPNNEPRAELNAGEMARVDFCPNPDCPGKRA